MKYLIAMAVMVLVWSVMRNWQQVQRFKARRAAEDAADERFATAKANLDIAYANQKFDEAEYRARLQQLQITWQKERGLI